MKRYRDYSFSSQLVMYAILISMGISIGITWLVILETKKMLKNEGLTHLETAAKQQEKKIIDKIENFELYSQFFIDSDLIPTYIQLRDQNVPTVTNLFESYCSRYISNFAIGDIKLFSANGKELYSNKKSATLIAPENIGKLHKVFYYSIPYKENQNYCMNAYVALKDENGLHTIAFKIDLTDIYYEINDTSNLGSTGETLLGLKTDSGTLFINPLRFDKDAAFIRYTQDTLNPIVKATNTKKGKGISIDYRGKEVIAVWFPIEKLGWGLVAKKDMDEVYKTLDEMEIRIIIVAVIFTFIAVIIALLYARTSIKPINMLRQAISELSKGSLVQKIDIRINKDEVGQMIGEVLELAAFQNSIVEFSKNVSNKEFEKNKEININKGEIGHALISMEQNLIRVEEEDKIKSWSNEGIAKFSTIIRDFSSNSEDFSSILINELVHYLNCLQGGIFVLNEEENILKQISYYGFDRQKFDEKSLQKGDGLLWQVIEEKEYILLKEIPSNYIKITTGLGEHQPKSIILFPLIINEEIYGVMELANFQSFEKHHVDFLKIVGENIAGALANIKINDKTKKLLEISQSKTNELATHEEEMRQNLEEMQATQEELVRIKEEIETKEAMLMSLVNTSEDTYFSIDRNYRILVANEALQKRVRAGGAELKIGANIFDDLDEAGKKHWQEIYDRILSGESFTDDLERKVGDTILYIKAVYQPVKNEKGEVVGASVMSKDVTELVKMKMRLKVLENKLND